MSPTQETCCHPEMRTKLKSPHPFILGESMQTFCKLRTSISLIKICNLFLLGPKISQEDVGLCCSVSKRSHWDRAAGCAREEGEHAAPPWSERFHARPHHWPPQHFRQDQVSSLISPSRC